MLLLNVSYVFLFFYLANHKYIRGVIDKYLSLTYRHCLTFSCGKLLQAELGSFVAFWNSHRIRPSRHADSPGGYPNDLYDMPETFGTHIC